MNLSHANQPIQAHIPTTELRSPSPALITPQPGSRLLGTAPRSRAHLNYSCWPVLNLPTLPFLFLATAKFPACVSPSPSALCLTLGLPHVALQGMVAPLFLGTVSNKLSCQGQSSDLSASSPLNHRETCIIKQGSGKVYGRRSTLL